MNKLLIIDPKILQPATGVDPKKGILDSLSTAHKSDWKIMLISNQSDIANGERTLPETIDNHQAIMRRYNGAITYSLFTPNQGGEMVIVWYGMAGSGQFHTESDLSQRIAREFGVIPSPDWFQLPNIGIVLAAMTLAGSRYQTTLVVADCYSDLGAVAATTGTPLANPIEFEENEFSTCA